MLSLCVVCLVLLKDCHFFPMGENKHIVRQIAAMLSLPVSPGDQGVCLFKAFVKPQDAATGMIVTIYGIILSTELNSDDCLNSGSPSM